MHDRDAIIAAVDLRALADELLGSHRGSERNPTWPCPNPHHAQTGRTPPVTVFTSHRGEQRWRCHGCGDGGTAIDLLLACRATDLRHAIEELADRAGLAPPAPNRERPSRPDHGGRTTHRSRRDPDALNAYVTSCAKMLWRREGETVRRWLAEERGLPESVLRANHIGADLGPDRQRRPDGMCRSGGAVLPVIKDGQAIYAQVRVLHPRLDRPRYLNPAGDLAPNPRLARFRPPTVEHPEVIITEGAIDALSATAAGYRAVALLSAAYPDRTIAHALSRLPHPLVVAFDADDAGRQGATRLTELLAAEHRPVVTLDLRHGDLNDTMIRSNDWGRHLSGQVAHAIAPCAARQARSLSR